MDKWTLEELKVRYRYPEAKARLDIKELWELCDFDVIEGFGVKEFKKLYDSDLATRLSIQCLQKLMDSGVIAAFNSEELLWLYCLGVFEELDVEELRGLCDYEIANVADNSKRLFGSEMNFIPSRLEEICKSEVLVDVDLGDLERLAISGILTCVGLNEFINLNNLGVLPKFSEEGIEILYRLMSLCAEEFRSLNSQKEKDILAFQKLCDLKLSKRRFFGIEDLQEPCNLKPLTVAGDNKELEKICFGNLSGLNANSTEKLCDFKIMENLSMEEVGIVFGGRNQLF